MIKRVKLKNFESHEDSEIEFTEGLNLLIGQSNQGKSSIVRAIALVVANQFDKEQVRTGKDFCEITVETDRGYVTAKRGESMNQWETCRLGESPRFYRNIGTTVPPETSEILGMGAVSHGDVTEMPNLMFQHEKHYMLSEINGKKATSNMIARMMDDAIGIGGMEELIKSMADELTSEKKNLNQINSEISETKSGLIDDVIFKSYEDLIDEMNRLDKEIQSDEELIRESLPIGRRIEEISTRKEFLNRALSSSESVLSEYRELERLVERLEALKKVFSLYSRLERIRVSCELANEIIQEFSSLEDSFKKLNDLRRLINIRSSLDSICLEDARVIIELSNEILCMKKDISVRRKDLNDARQLYLDIQSVKKEVKNSDRRLQDKKRELDDLKNRLGVCPLCGASLKAGD